MRMCSIASGSSGNCIYVGSDNTHVLVDAGISGKRITEGLSALELIPADIDAILVTHEHADHIAGLGVMARRYGIPIYGTKKTLQAILQDRKVGEIDPCLLHAFASCDSFSIGDLHMAPMAISHDAADPVAYRIGQQTSGGEKKVAICTDLGTFTEETIGCLQGLDALLLEANHDVRMLQLGPYTYQLKMRILSDKGHLSNENAGRLLDRILHDHMQHIFLGHLSKENNMPALAHEAVRLEITMSQSKYHGNDFPIEVAKRDGLSSVIHI